MLHQYSFKTTFFTLILEKCKQNLIDVCITGEASVDNTEWVSLTCHSNLSDGKLPVYEFSWETRMPKLYTFRRKIMWTP